MNSKKVFKYINANAFKDGWTFKWDNDNETHGVLRKNNVYIARISYENGFYTISSYVIVEAIPIVEKLLEEHSKIEEEKKKQQKIRYRQIEINRKRQEEYDAKRVLGI